MVENQNIEWKAKWKDEYIKWICGFANSSGGTLYVGVNDKGKVVGVNDGARLLIEIPNKIREFLGIIVETELKNKGSLEYIEIRVRKYPYPISYKGKYYLRSGSNTYEVFGSELDRILLSKIGVPYDGIIVPDFSLKNLSEEAIYTFKEKAVENKIMASSSLDVSNTTLLRNLRLLTDEGIKTAGILLFAKDPEEWITSSYIKMGFLGSGYLNEEYLDIVHGPLILQVDKSLDLLYKKYFEYLKALQKKTRFKRDIIPQNIMREIITNAVVHKSYNSASPVQIKIYENRCVVWNPAEYPYKLQGLNIYETHGSYGINPNILYAFTKCGLASGWGLGFDMIKKECIKSDCHLPGFKGTGVSVQVRCRYLEDYMNYQSSKRRIKSSIDKERLLKELEMNSEITKEDLERILKRKI